MSARAVLVRVDGQDATKPAFESAKRNVEGLGESVKGLLNPLELLKGAIAGLGLLAVSEFLKSSVEAAADNEAAWSRIAVAVHNVGIEFDGVRGDLKATLSEMADGTRYSETQVASAFGELLTLSKDYKGSIEAMNIVTNLAAAQQIDLQTSAELVGRVMTGNTQMLSRYGITVKAGADAMQVLRDQFSGFAERDGQSLQGRLAQISNAWEDFKIALGEALTNTNDEKDAADKLLGALKSITQWIDDNKSGWQDFEDRLIGIRDRFREIKNQIDANVSSSPTAFGAFVRFMMGRQAGIQDELEHPERAYARERSFELRAFVDPSSTLPPPAAPVDIVAQNRAAADRARANDPFAEHGEIVAAQQIEANQAAVDAEAIAADRKRLAAILAGIGSGDAAHGAGQLDKLGKNFIGSAAENATPNLPRAIPITVGATAASRPEDDALSFNAEMRAGTADATAGLKGVEDSFDSLGRTIGEVRGGALTDFFSAWQDGIADVITGHESLGQAIVNSARKAIGQAMAAEGQATLLKAAAAAAEGLTNPAKFVEAAKLFAAGTAELGFAAALSGGGGGSAGSGGGPGVAGFQAQQNQIGGQGKATVVLPGKNRVIDPNDPDQLNALRDALQTLVGTRDLEFIFAED